jgi:hypothetical protein
MIGAIMKPAPKQIMGIVMTLTRIAGLFTQHPNSAPGQFDYRK